MHIEAGAFLLIAHERRDETELCIEAQMVTVEGQYLLLIVITMLPAL